MKYLHVLDLCLFRYWLVVMWLPWAKRPFRMLLWHRPTYPRFGLRLWQWRQTRGPYWIIETPTILRHEFTLSDVTLTPRTLLTLPVPDVEILFGFLKGQA